ncbi:MAG TPA: hypothetical protein VFX63_06470 [Pyrinomonadaceae bacterium]|nr:hypothetical protein [Pyrinomonadaceae bacterium]
MRYFVDIGLVADTDMQRYATCRSPLKDLIGPVLPALVPFLFVALLKVPFQVILDSLIKLWF